jgi:hypothetical protein
MKRSEKAKAGPKFRAKLKRGWFLFTADKSYFCKMADEQNEPPLIAGETARVPWSGSKWPKPIKPSESGQRQRKGSK